MPAKRLYPFFSFTPKYVHLKKKMSLLRLTNDNSHQFNLRKWVGRIQSIYTFATEYAHWCLIR